MLKRLLGQSSGIAGRYRIVLSAVLALCLPAYLQGLTRLTKNDPYPLYSSMDPFDFLTTCKRNVLKEYLCEEPCNFWARVSFSPFRASADAGLDIFENEAEIGDLAGPWNIIGLFYDRDTRDLLIEGLGLDRTPTFTVCNASTFAPGSLQAPPDGDVAQFNLITDPVETDTKLQFGFFTVPVEYRKYGFRVEGQVTICQDYILTIKGGIANIHQEPSFFDLTCSSTGLECPVRDCGSSNVCNAPTCCPPTTITDQPETSGIPCNNNDCCVGWSNCACKQFVITRIMNQKDRLAELLGVNIHEFKKTGFEDIELDFTWVHPFVFNENRCDWAQFVFMPYLTLGITLPTGRTVQPNDLFALPFGNNGHWSYGGCAGLLVDWAETIGIGADAEFTGFTPKTFHNFPVPTNRLQSGIFPRLADVTVQPGLNWRFSAWMSAYHFLDRLSAYVQYAVVSHDKDDYDILNFCDNFSLGIPPQERVSIRTLRDVSAWRFHVVNVGLNYDIAPCVQLGALWQIPVSQQNSYRATTIMGSVNIYY